MKQSQNTLLSASLPAWIVKHIVRQRLKSQILNKRIVSVEEFHKRNQDLMAQLLDSPIALIFDQSDPVFDNLPVQFYQLFLGNRLKFSTSLWYSASNLDAADEYTLRDYCVKADIQDGQKIMDLGCGWGPLTFYISENYKNCTIIAITNSILQKKYIEQQIKQKGITNIKLVINNINNYDTSEKFDRIISIEMFEYLRNYRKLFEKVNFFLKDQGKIFVQSYVFRDFTYLFNPEDRTDVLSQFFKGGTMPWNYMLYQFNDHFKVVNHWVYKGIHSQQTLGYWIDNFTRNKEKINGLFYNQEDKDFATRFYNQWFTLLITLYEMSNFNGGNEWFTSQYLMMKNEIDLSV